MDDDRFRAYKAELEREKQLGLLSPEEYDRRIEHLLTVCGACPSWKAELAGSGYAEGYERSDQTGKHTVPEKPQTPKLARVCGAQQEGDWTDLPRPKCFGYADLFELTDRCQNCRLADDCEVETYTREGIDIDKDTYEQLAFEGYLEARQKLEREERERKQQRDAFIVLVVFLLLLTIWGLLFSHSDYGRYEYEDRSHTYGHPYLR
jgi:hypothetical protein